MEDQTEKVNASLIGMWFATLAYLSLVAIAISPTPGALLALQPNELGDFLAGAFAPLAFMWLAFGYIMQSSELRMQRLQLEAQRQELKLHLAEFQVMAIAQRMQSEQSKRTGDLLQTQFDLDKAEKEATAKPRIRARLISEPIGGHVPGTYTLCLRFENFGQEVGMVKITIFESAFDGCCWTTEHSPDRNLDLRPRSPLDIEFTTTGDPKARLDLELGFVDQGGITWRQSFTHLDGFVTTGGPSRPE